MAVVQGYLVEALGEFHSHVHSGFSFDLSASPLLRKLLYSTDPVLTTSDALSVFMFLASRDKAFQVTSRRMLQRLHAEGRVDDMFRVYTALVSTGNVSRLATEQHLNRLLVALLSKDRFVTWMCVTPSLLLLLQLLFLRVRLHMCCRSR